MSFLDLVTPYLPTLAVILGGAALILWLEVKRRDIMGGW